MSMTRSYLLGQQACVQRRVGARGHINDRFAHEGWDVLQVKGLNKLEQTTKIPELK